MKSIILKDGEIHKQLEEIKSLINRLSENVIGLSEAYHILFIQIQYSSIQYSTSHVNTFSDSLLMGDPFYSSEFELIVLEAFARLGYKVTHTSWSGDEGIDGILVKGGNKIVIQCKKQKSKVGQPALRDFLGAMKHANCSEGIFITTSSFSNPAKSFVKEKNIKLENPLLGGE